MPLLENIGVGILKGATYVVKGLRYSITVSRKLLSHVWSHLLGYMAIVWFIDSLVEPDEVKSLLCIVISFLCLVMHRQEHLVHKSGVTLITEEEYKEDK